MKPRHPAAQPLPPGAVMPPMQPSVARQELSPEAAQTGGDGHQARNRPGRSRPNKPSKPQAKPPRLPSVTGERFQTINTFVDVIMRDLSDRAAKAWIILWRDTKPNGLAATGIADLARRMGCSHATAKRAVAELRGRHLMVVESLGGIGRGPSVYRLKGEPWRTPDS